MTVNTVVLTPIPSARATTTAAVNQRSLMSNLDAKRRSCRRASKAGSPRASRWRSRRDAAPPTRINAARLALGGVAHKPWRANAAEKKLIGQEANAKTFRAAAEAELAPAKGYKYNSFKIELAKRAIIRALSTVAEMN